MRTTDLISIGEVAERSGVAPSALRYYESQGLIESVRTAGNQRRYARSTLRRIAFVRSAQRVGLTLEEITAALATLPNGRTPTRADWTRLSRDWRPRLDAQIERLERLRDKLDGCIGCGCLSLRTCVLNNPTTSWPTADREPASWSPGSERTGPPDPASLCSAPWSPESLSSPRVVSPPASPPPSAG